MSLPNHLKSPLWIADPHMPGAARPLEDSEPADHAPTRVYGSLAGTVLYEGVQACVFDAPLKAEPIWNGKRVAANEYRIQGLAPDGVRATYKIVALPGHPLLSPPRHPSELPG